MHATDEYFERLYQQDDPYGYRTRWYEERKRQLLLACLPRPRFHSGWELGCSNGEQTAALATRCDRLLATDQSPRAVALAQTRVQALAHVRVECAAHPQAWPEGIFNLIVFSEVGYFLQAEAMQRCARQLGPSLAEGGVLIACHWRRDFAEARLSTKAVHETLQRELGLPRMLTYRDEDLLLEAWSRGLPSVAAAEGLA